MSLSQYIPRSAKQVLRARYRMLRAALTRTLFSFTPEQLVQTLRSLGIRPGDTILAHTAFASFEGFSGGIAQAIQALQESVGDGGTLLLPTMPFSGSAYAYARSGSLTDIRRTPSRMGLLTEVFRRRPDVIRSIHPTHPVAAWGAHASSLTSDHYRAPTPCGAGSPFHRLLEAGGKILLAGVDIRCLTFFHYLEERLEPKMPFSPFTPDWFDLETRGADGRIYQTRTRLFDPSVGARRDLRMLVEPLRSAGLWREGRVGRLRLTMLTAAGVTETAEAMAEKGEFCYAQRA